MEHLGIATGAGGEYKVDALAELTVLGGAVQYASSHGIATITVVEGRLLPTDRGVSSHTIDSEHTEALNDWLAG